jgi:uncharacterized protein YwgA
MGYAAEVSNQKRILASIIHHAGLNSRDVQESFEARFRIQKLVYLLQHLSFRGKLNYNFSLYLRGPYSLGLASDYYTLSEATPPVSLEPKQMNDIKKLLEFTDAELELLSTIVSVLDYSPNASPKDVVFVVKNLKPKYTDEQIKSMLERARELLRNK